MTYRRPPLNYSVYGQIIFSSHFLFSQVKVLHQNDSTYKNISSLRFRYIVILKEIPNLNLPLVCIVQRQLGDPRLRNGLVVRIGLHEFNECILKDNDYEITNNYIKKTLYGKRFRSSAFFMSNRVTVKAPEKALLEFVNKCNLKQDRLIFLALEDV